MDKVLIDTDVLLDFFFDRKPFSDDAATILMLCEKGEIKGFVTAVMISNMYFILRKSAKHEKVIENLTMLMDIVDVSIITKDCVNQALKSRFSDFEDALQNFSAANEQNIQIIITRNVKDYKTSNLSIMNPETYLKSVQFTRNI